MLSLGRNRGLFKKKKKIKERSSRRKPDFWSGREGEGQVEGDGDVVRFAQGGNLALLSQLGHFLKTLSAVP